MKKIDKFLKERGFFYKKNEPLAPYTTLGIGGVAEYIVFPREENLIYLMEILKSESIPFYVIGGGSNILVSDKGFHGVIINTKRIDFMELKGFHLTVGSGVKLGKIIAFLFKKNLSGMEGLVGIPGTIGGAVFGNAGSFGYETKDCIEEIEIIDEDLKEKVLKKSVISFTYRNSGLPQNTVIKRVTLALKETKEDIFLKMIDYLNKKRQTQPLKERSAGCVFKNPEGISAGALIERAGLKGFRVGDIVVSHVHANYFINLGRGSCKDFLQLMDIVRERIFKVFSVELEPEIKILEV